MIRQRLAFALASLALLASCSPGVDGFGGNGSGTGLTAGNNGPGGPNGTNGSFGNNTAGTGQVTGTCSADLQGIVLSDGTTQPCPPDQGCFGGACIPACEAAAQSKGSIGCDFYAPDPPFVYNGSGQPIPIYGPCYAVFLANTWTRPARLTLERGGTMLDVTSSARIPVTNGGTTSYQPLPAEGLPPDQVAILFLSHQPGVQNIGNSLECPVQPAVIGDAAPSGTNRGQAFRLTSDTPLSSYDILPYGGALSFLPSASLLFPSTSWGTNFVVTAPRTPLQVGQLWMQVVGAEDNTTITVSPASSMPGSGSVPALNQGQVTTTTVNRGEIVQWLGGDPRGTVIQTDKPVGLYTGSTYLGVQTATMGPGGQDSAHQQMPHVQALGSEYVGAGIVTRLASLQPESVAYQVMGTVDGTTLTWEPSVPNGAPTTLNVGQVVEFESTTPFVVRSQDEQHPFTLTQYMSGTSQTGTRTDCVTLGQPCGLGDEEWINLTPPVQFLQRYVFFTDPTYGTTNLVVIRKRLAGGFADVNLECLGPITGWQPVGSSGDYEYAHVDLIRRGVPSGNCGTSRHEANSAAPFSVVVWGTDAYASYGYQAGGNIGSVNTVEVPPVPQ